MSIKLTLKIQDTPQQLEKKVVTAYRSSMNAAMKRAVIDIRSRIQGVCESLIEGSETYQSLIQGDLLGELGIPDVEGRIKAIIQTIKDGVIVTSYPAVISQGKLKGGIVIKLLKSDFADILNMPESSYVSLPSGETIPWLEWLLVGGSQIIVFDHHIIKDLNERQRRHSRTGKALMRPGGSWRVPPAFAGHADDNFLTQAFDVVGVEKLIANIIEEEVGRRL